MLLVDEQCASIEQQLRQPDLGYIATCTHNAMEALELLRYSNGKFAKAAHYDIILADARLVAMEDTTGKAFIDACEGVPVVLMAEQGSAKDVMRSVQLGAVDFLDKPLSTLKLKNIWQHCVRKMMKSNLGKNLSNFEIMRPCYSELGASTATHTAPLPSSMTAPIVPGANTGYICTGIAGYAGVYGSVGNQLNMLGENAVADNNGTAANSKQVASPSTPSGSDIEGAAGESTSAASNHAGDHTNDHGTGTGNGNGNDRSDDGDIKSKKKVVVRRKKKLNEVAETRAWPALESGCTWGTPVGSVLPPPLARSKSDSYAAVARAAAALAAGGTNANANTNSASDASDPSIQRCMIRTPSLASGGDAKVGMQSGQFFKNSGGAPPLGLKLKKSSSLLNLINERLGS